MPSASQTIAFEGYFAEGVWGIFKIICGFADLRDLAAVSVPYEPCLPTGRLSDAVELGRVAGHQHRLNENMALDIKKYFEQDNSRLIPEVISSFRDVLTNLTDQEIATFSCCHFPETRPSGM